MFLEQYLKRVKLTFSDLFHKKLGGNSDYATYFQSGKTMFNWKPNGLAGS